MKILGADFAKKVEVNTRGKNIALSYTDKNGKFRVIRVDKDLEVWEQITEENKFKFGPSMGWGFLGAVILGPIGAIYCRYSSQRPSKTVYSGLRIYGKPPMRY